MKLKVLIKSKEGAETLSLTDASSYTIGRKDAAIVLTDARCSKAHALLFEADGRLKLKDLNSSNGTLVNGQKVAESELTVGDEITIGTTLLVCLDVVLESPGAGRREPSLSEPSHKAPSSEVLNQWPDNLRSLPKKNLGEFLDFIDEDAKKKSVRLSELMKKKQKR